VLAIYRQCRDFLLQGRPGKRQQAQHHFSSAGLSPLLLGWFILIIKLVGHRYLLFLLRYLFQRQATTQEFDVLVGENKFFGCALVRHNLNIELASLRQPHTDFVALSFSSLVDPMTA
jgi:hypothetical protein